jgi:hypothetical protein
MRLGGLIKLRGLAVAGLAAAIGVGVGESPAPAQPSPSVVRLALLQQWMIHQHRAGRGLNPALRDAVEKGVVDRTVFSWQRGVLQREALVRKPIRLVPDDEAAALGGRGRFTLVGVRPPGGQAAWTEVEVSRAQPGPADVFLLEIGGERNTMTQVLETLIVVDPARGLVELPLARAALIAGGGVLVVPALFEQPLPAAMAQRFRPEAGMDLLVARSPLWDIRNGAQTSSGPADTAPLDGSGDWREGDRLFLRISAAALERGLPGLVLGWKDRTLQPDPDSEMLPRRSSLPLPVVR